VARLGRAGARPASKAAGTSPSKVIRSASRKPDNPGSRTYVPFATVWHGIRVSDLLPYSWLVRLPGLSGFREADRMTLLGLVPAALLAGRAVDWLRAHAVVALIPVLALAALELGWPGRYGEPAVMPALDGPIAASQSSSIVVDVPYGLRSGGIGDYGQPIDSYTSWLPSSTVTGIERHPFFRDLAALENGQSQSARDLAEARADAREMNVGWILLWPCPGHWTRLLPRFLDRTGFALDYRADGVTVYRAAQPRGSRSDR
jgi:hypothetical protein